MWEAIAQGGWRGEIWNRRRTGEVFPAWASITPVRDENGAVTHYIGLLSDISEHKAQTARIEELAFYDSLTGLPNRELFMDRLRQALASAYRRESGAMLLFMDLNDFKEINDSQGHDVGDRVLVEVASRFLCLIRESGTLARFGGDEFAVIAEGASQEGAAVIADRLQQALAEPVRLPEGVFPLQVSIGIALAPADGESPEELIKNADIAMYRAKAVGGGHHFYQMDLGAELNRRLAVTSRLSRALEEDGLTLYYQPQVDLITGEWLDAEALLRWFDPEWGMVPPAEFVPLAEERGLASPLGEWVLREASRQLATWQAEGSGLFPSRLAVNVGVRQLEEPDLADRLLEILGESGLPPRPWSWSSLKAGSWRMWIGPSP